MNSHFILRRSFDMKYYSIEEMRALSNYMNRNREKRERTPLRELVVFFLNLYGRTRKSEC